MSKHVDLGRSICQMLQSTMQPDGSILRNKQATFSISVEDAYDHDIVEDDVDPDDLFDEMTASIAEMRPSMPP
ncbi:hypothetical protein CMQ_3309 [Grosmannia clavigera kw1407]|uniref:Uncharacterized protein n=1 Tax=Grosmannia clavigera (strain kw1407 / UAMH 11150) TaxID=655863 RepID=F0X922_GROCL|nr:uncharacterized protein CMQ_3309 [Grosmannia clavigera kw1407]EFX05240.1 hypothetical protein CMQ_3309 [Grosmannia clavigera kw1407]